MNKEELTRFKALLPARITVKVEKNADEEGVWAQVIDLPHCYTQASNISELPGMVTDAILRHFEVPEEYHQALGQYIPVSEKHLRLEEMFKNLVSIEEKALAGEEVEETFSRAEACAV